MYDFCQNYIVIVSNVHMNYNNTYLYIYRNSRSLEILFYGTYKRTERSYNIKRPLLIWTMSGIHVTHNRQCFRHGNVYLQLRYTCVQISVLNDHLDGSEKWKTKIKLQSIEINGMDGNKKTGGVGYPSRFAHLSVNHQLCNT